MYNDLKVAEKRFRPELEGIRALAAILVAVYHVWLGRVSGGVDLFFVVSGYLITTSLLNQILKTEKINFKAYYLGLTRRLFPLAYTVITVIAIMSIFFMPKSLWVDTIPQAFASIFYFENWQLAWNSVDYLANNDTSSSPFQHFWALSLQGQFYITWPILITFVYLLATKILKSAPRKTLLIILLVISSISLGYSIYLTNINQPFAYFNTFARVWEFGLGGILSLILPYIKVSRIVSFIIGWLGILILLFTGIIFPVSTMFPGYIALLPISAAMMIIISAEQQVRFSALSFLSLKPLQKFGAISYGFYLWHWPVLIFYYMIYQTNHAGLLDGILILLVSYILSFVTSSLIEKPIRNISNTKQLKKLTFVSTMLLISVTAVTASWLVMKDNLQSAVIADIADYPGALSIYYDLDVENTEEYLPNYASAFKDVPSFYAENCLSEMDANEEVVECVYGEIENPIATIALVGGSHSGHWFPALEKVAEEEKLKIRLLNRDACRFSSNDFNGRLSTECMKWNDNVQDLLMEDPVDIIFTTANTNAAELLPKGYMEKWRQFEGISTIFAIRDNPRMSFNAPVCLEQNAGDAESCSELRSEKLSELPPWETTPNIPSNVEFADLSDYFCNDESCATVIGNVIIYRDEHHLTASYAKTLAEPLKDVLMPIVQKVIREK